MTDKKNTPPQSPSHDKAPGYAEKQPRDKGDAAQPDHGHKPNPDEGGLDREPETTPGE